MYKSKIDTWLLVLMLASTFGPSMLIFSKSIPYALVYAALLAAFFLPLLMGTYYRIEGEVLQIKSGFLHNQKVAVKDIQKIKETKDLISSPALSLDRLAIFTGRYDSVLVSPKDKDAFIAHLLSINPNINVERRK